MNRESARSCLHCEVFPNTLFGRIGERVEMPAMLRSGQRTMRRNTVIHNNGRYPRELYTIYTGWCARSVVLQDGRKLILDFYVPGDFLTLPALLGETTFGSIQTITDAALCTFAPERLRTWIHDDERMRRIVECVWKDQCREAQRRMLDLGVKSAEEKVASLLLHLRTKLARIKPVGDVIEFPLRLTHIAEATGITPVHASRTIKALEADHLIERVPGGLRMPDIAALRDMACEVEANTA